MGKQRKCGAGQHGGAMPMHSNQTTIWSQSFDLAAGAGDNGDDDVGDHDDDLTCESAIGVRSGEDELI